MFWLNEEGREEGGSLLEFLKSRSLNSGIKKEKNQNKNGKWCILTQFDAMSWTTIFKSKDAKLCILTVFET